MFRSKKYFFLYYLQLEFNTRNPLVAEKVVNFLTQFNFGKVRKVREGLKLLLSNWWPHLQIKSHFQLVNTKSSLYILFWTFIDPRYVIYIFQWDSCSNAPVACNKGHACNYSSDIYLHAANSSSVACNGSNVVVCFAGDWECSGWLQAGEWSDHGGLSRWGNHSSGGKHRGSHYYFFFFFFSLNLLVCL